MHTESRYGEDMRTTVDLPDPIIHNARLLAGERGVTFSAIVEDALRHHLSPGPPSELPPVKLPTVRGRPLRPDLDLDRTSALEIAEDKTYFGAVRA